jgi:hypothetical protein
MLRNKDTLSGGPPKADTPASLDSFLPAEL